MRWIRERVMTLVLTCLVGSGGLQAAGEHPLGEVGEIFAVEAARDEREWARRVRAAVRAQPCVKVVRLVGECAHVGDAHVEEVPGIVGGRPRRP